MITLVIAGWRNTQASATRATETPCAAAIGRIASTTRNARGRSTGGKSNVVRRAPSGPEACLLELAAQQTAGERAPHQNAQTLIECDRHDLALELSSRNRIVRLDALEAIPSFALGDAQRFHDLPRGVIRYADVAHLAGPYEIFERAQRLVQRRHLVHAVDLIEIDVIEAEAAQAGVNLVHDVHAREAHAIGLRTHAHAHFGSDHQIFARQPELRERFPDDLLGLAFGIDIGRIDEIDAGVERGLDLRLGFGHPETPDDFPASLAAVGHGAQTDLGHEQAGAAQQTITHRFFPFVED